MDSSGWRISASTIEEEDKLSFLLNALGATYGRPVPSGPCSTEVKTKANAEDAVKASRPGGFRRAQGVIKLGDGQTPEGLIGNLRNYGDETTASGDHVLGAKVCSLCNAESAVQFGSGDKSAAFCESCANYVADFWKPTN